MTKAAAGSAIPIKKTWARKARDTVLASQPIVYLCAILLATLISYVYGLRAHSIFACQADGYSHNRYLAYCNGPNYADYEHGAFAFDLEPSAANFAKNADVMFLGNSRLQVAFSTVAATDWFSAASAHYYLMGFGYFENVTFAEELLRKIHPRPRIYIINMDGFFDRSETLPVQAILHDPQSRNRYERKHFWQLLHEPICETFTALCGSQYAIFRSRENGAYTEQHYKGKITPVSYDQVISHDVVNSSAATAIDFLSHLKVSRKCIVLTMVPTVGTKIGDANAIATMLGMKLVTPQDMKGLQTFDGSHLDRASAEAWSKAFFQAAGSKIRSCLAEQDVAHR
jgi:hypothetical protein